LAEAFCYSRSKLNHCSRVRTSLLQNQTGVGSLFTPRHTQGFQDAHLLLDHWNLGFSNAQPCSFNKKSCRTHQSTIVTNGVMSMLLCPDIIFAFDIGMKPKGMRVSSRPLLACASVQFTVPCKDKTFDLLVPMVWNVVWGCKWTIDCTATAKECLIIVIFCFVLRIDQIHTGGQFRSFSFKPQLRPHALALHVVLDGLFVWSVRTRIVN
jgi:hypothetical protein